LTRTAGLAGVRFDGGSVVIRELSPAEMTDLWRRHRFARLGVRDAEGVAVIPISYAMDGDTIVGHSPAGHKLQLMRLWPHVGLEIDEIEDEAHWQTVLVRGRFHELTDPIAQQAARLALLKAFDGNPAAVTAGHGHRTTLADAVVFRVSIESMTGRAHCP
jgi:uncharacterized protein